jgi:hypothetical protein
MPAEIARREFRRTLALIRTAVSMAAAERKRHGKDCPPEMRRDAAQDVAVEMAAKVAANIAQEHGTRVSARRSLLSDRGPDRRGPADRRNGAAANGSRTVLTGR